MSQGAWLQGRRLEQDGEAQSRGTQGGSGHVVLPEDWKDWPVKARRMLSLLSPSSPPVSLPLGPQPSPWDAPSTPPRPTDGGRGFTKAYPHFMGDSHVQAACAPWDRDGRPQQGERGTAPGPGHCTQRWHTHSPHAHTHTRTHACLCVNRVKARHGAERQPWTLRAPRALPSPCLVWPRSRPRQSPPPRW